MAKKIAHSGLQYFYLKLVCDRDGEDGIRNLFTELVNGRVRVTKCQKIICGVANYF